MRGRALGSGEQVALVSEQVVSLELTIQNPKLDRDGAAGRGLVQLLATTLGKRPLGGPR